MKRILALTLTLVLTQAVSAQDDLYFAPKPKVAPAARTEKPTAARVPVQRTTTVDYGVCSRSDNEYNRRYIYNGDQQNAGGLYQSDSLAADSAGAYDFDDPELDYRYSRRLARFHSPRYYSPYYWDLMYAWGAWDYLYDPWDPWYWHYGWGYGWSWGPWDCWYGGIWGWSHPCHWAYWGWGPGWHTYWGVGSVVGSVHNYRPRGNYMTSSGGRVGGMRQRTNPGSYVGRGNSAVVRSSGMRGSGLAMTGNGRTSGNRNTAAARSNGRTLASRSAAANRTDYTGGRLTTDRYGQRGLVTPSTQRYGTASSSSATRSFRNSNSSSRSSYTPTYTAPSTYSSGSVSHSSGGGGSYSGGGGGGRSGGSGGRR